MTNKIISVLTVVFMLVSFGSVFADSTPVHSVDERIFEVVSYGIVSADDVGNVNISKSVSRGEFACMMAKMLRLDKSHISGKTFVDVPADSPAYASIGIMASLGYMNGVGNGIFEPERIISFREAVITLMRILGYSDFENDESVAMNLGLYKDLSMSTGELNIGNACVLIYNALDIEMLTKIGDEYIEIGTLRNRHMYKDGDGLVNVTGVVTANYESYLYSANSALEEDQIEIDGVTYNAGQTNADKFFGMEVSAYVDMGGKVPQIISVMPTADNLVIRVERDDIEALTDEKIIYYDGDKLKEKKYTNIRVLKNGRLLNSGYTASEFNIGRGWVEMTDNNGDGEFDVMHIFEYDNYQIKSVRKNSIELANGAKVNGSAFINIDIESDEKLYVFLDKDGNKTDLEALKPNDIISVFKDANSILWKFIISDVKIQGKVTSVADDEIEIDGENIGTLGLDLSSVSPGAEGIMYVDFKGYAAFFDETSQSETYAYLTDINNKKTSIDSSVQIKMICGGNVKFEYQKNLDNLDDANSIPKLICQNEDVKIMSVTDNTTIDGKKYINNPASLKEGLYEYKLSSDGSIKSLKSVLLVSGGSELKYNPNDKVFGGNLAVSPFAINDETKVLCVPTNNAGSDDDYFVPLEISAVLSSVTYEVYAYEYDESTKKVGLIVFRQHMDSGDIPRVKKGKSYVAMVKGVSSALGENGEASSKVTLIDGGNEVSFIISDDAENENYWKNLKEGDLIYYSKTVDGKYAGTELICSAKKLSDSGFTKNVGFEDEQYFGNIIDISYDDIDIATYSLETNITLNCGGTVETVGIPNRNKPPVFVVDGREDVRAGSVDEFELGSDMIYIITYYGDPTACVIVK